MTREIALFDEARRYLTMTQRCIEKDTFNPEIVYDFFMMGAEKALAACLIEHGSMPTHHTLAALLDDLALWEPIPDDVRAGLVGIESCKNICSLVKAELERIDYHLYPKLLSGVEVVRTFLAERTLNRSP